MLLETRCTVCGDRVSEHSTVECTTCGEQLHESCVDYEQTYGCPDCGDEHWIGALEF